MYADNQRAGEILGWSPQVDLEEGLRLTIAWYRRYLTQFGDPTSPLAQLGV
jgi:nucleoside-diphosphate-sugar epimerase